MSALFVVLLLAVCSALNAHLHLIFHEDTFTATVTILGNEPRAPLELRTPLNAKAHDKHVIVNNLISIEGNDTVTITGPINRIPSVDFNHAAKRPNPIVWSTENLAGIRGFENMVLVDGASAPLEDIVVTVDFPFLWSWEGFGAEATVILSTPVTKRVSFHKSTAPFWLLHHGLSRITIEGKRVALTPANLVDSAWITPKGTFSALLIAPHHSDSIRKVVDYNIAVSHSFEEKQLQEAIFMSAVLQRATDVVPDFEIVGAIAHAVVFGLEDSDMDALLDDLHDVLTPEPFESAYGPETRRMYEVLRMLSERSSDPETLLDKIDPDHCPFKMEALSKALNEVSEESKDTDFLAVLDGWMELSDESVLYVDLDLTGDHPLLIFRQLSHENTAPITFKIFRVDSVDREAEIIMTSSLYAYSYTQKIVQSSRGLSTIREESDSEINPVHHHNPGLVKEMSYQRERWAPRRWSSRLDRDYGTIPTESNEIDEDYKPIPRPYDSHQTRKKAHSPLIHTQTPMFRPINEGHKHGPYRVVYSATVLPLFKLEIGDLELAAVDTFGAVKSHVLAAYDGINVLLSIAETDAVFSLAIKLVQALLITFGDSISLLQTSIAGLVSRRLLPKIDLEGLDDMLTQEDPDLIPTTLPLLLEALLMVGDVKIVAWAQTAYDSWLYGNMEYPAFVIALLKRAAAVYGNGRNCIEVKMLEMGWVVPRGRLSVIALNLIAMFMTSIRPMRDSAWYYISQPHIMTFDLLKFIWKSYMDRLVIITWTMFKMTWFMDPRTQAPYIWWYNMLTKSLLPIGIHQVCLNNVHMFSMAWCYLFTTRLLSIVWLGMQFMAVKNNIMRFIKFLIVCSEFLRKHGPWDPSRANPLFWRRGRVAYDFNARERHETLPSDSQK